MAQRKLKPPAFYHHFHYMRDLHAYRVWCTRDPGDMFEVIPIEAFEPIIWFLCRFPAMFREGFPEDNAGEVVCEICKQGRLS